MEFIKYENGNGQTLWYIIKDGELFINLNNVSYLCGRNAKLPFMHIIRKIKNKYKFLHTSRASYLHLSKMKLIEDFLDRKNQWEYSKYQELVKPMLNNIQEEVFMSKFMNELNFQSVEDEPSKVSWFLGEDDIVWYDAVDILGNTGFEKSTTNVKEFFGKELLDMSRPRKVRAGRVFWNTDTLDEVKAKYLESSYETGLIKWDNVEAIKHLVLLEISREMDSKKELLTEYCHVVTELNQDELDYLIDNGYSYGKTKISLPVVGQVRYIYNKKKTTLPECKKFLRGKLDIDRLLKDLESKVDSIITEYGSEGKISLNTVGKSFDKGIVPKEVWEIFKGKGWENYGQSWLASKREYTLDKNYYVVGEDISIKKYNEVRKLKNSNYSSLVINISPLGNKTVLFKYREVKSSYVKEELKSRFKTQDKLNEIREWVLNHKDNNSNITTSMIKTTANTLKVKPPKFYDFMKEEGYVKAGDCLWVIANNYLPKDPVLLPEELGEEPEPLTKTIRYKELTDQKGWWVFKKETWEVKEVSVPEDQVESFKNSLQNQCEILEII